jgi:hypothetical protein
MSLAANNQAMFGVITDGGEVMAKVAKGVGETRPKVRF